MAVGDALMMDVDIWLHDFRQVRSMQIQQCKEYKIEKFLQGSEQLSFRLQLTDPKLVFMHEDQLLFAEGEYWYIDHFEDTHPGDKMVVCNARHITELTWRVRFGNFSVLAQTPAAGLALILAGSGWTVDVAPGSVQLYTMEEIDASTLSLLRRWAAITGYELSFDSVAKTVSMVAAVGEPKGVGFRWGHSLKEIHREYYPPPATRLYPVGANNLTINAVNPTGLPYIEDYSFYEAQGLTTLEARNLYRKDLPWVDERYLLAVNLYDAAVARLAKLSQPRVFYSAKVVDLSRIMDADFSGYKPGDTTVVDDEILGVLEQVRVTRTLVYPKDPKRDEVELGFLTNGLLDVSDGGNRSIDYDNMFMIIDVNADPIVIGGTTNNYNSVALTSAGAASILTGSTFVGTATGTGTIEWRMVLDGVVQGKAYSKAFTNGELVEFSWPSLSTDIPEGAHVVDWRAQIISGSGTVLLAAEHGRSWVLSRGAVGVGINASPNAFIAEVFDDEDMAVVVFTEDVNVDLIMVPIGTTPVTVQEEFVDADMPAVVMTDRIIVPFKLEDPVFGEIDSFYALSGPDDPFEIGFGQYHPPAGGASGGSKNFGPGGSDLPPDPILDLGPLVYLRGDEGVIASGAVVSAWQDQSGNGWHATSISGREPATGTHNINGVNGMRFETGDVMSFAAGVLTALDAAGEGELFIVSKNDTNDASQGAAFEGFCGHAEYQHINFSDGNLYCGFGSTVRKNTGNPTFNLTTAHLQNYRSAAGAWSAFIQNVSHFTTATNTVDFTGGISSNGATPGGFLGGNVTANSGTGLWWAGVLCEFIIFSRVLTTLERADVVDALNDRYSLGL
jgi:phage minor structural protein